MSDARQCHPSPSYTTFKGLDMMMPPLAAYRHHHHSAPHYSFMAPRFALLWARIGPLPTHSSHLCFSSLIPSRLRVGTRTMVVGMGRLIPRMQTMMNAGSLPYFHSHDGLCLQASQKPVVLLLKTLLPFSWACSVGRFSCQRSLLFEVDTSHPLHDVASHLDPCQRVQ